MSYTPQVNFDTLTLYLGICATGRATASSTTLDTVSFGTVYNPQPGITFLPSDVGMPIAICGGGPVDGLMPPAYFVQGGMFHTTIAAYVSPTEVTLAAAPDTSIFNTGFATVILYRPCPMASDQANVPTQFQWNSSIAPGTADTLQFSTLNSLGGALGTDNPYIDRFGAIKRGQPVYLVSSDPDVGDIFGGYIDTLTTSSYPGVPGVPYCWSATCASWQGLAKRRVVPPAIPQVLTATAGDIAFRTIVLDYLSDDSVSVTAPSGLPPITIACAVGANIGQLLDQVVSLLSTADQAYYWTSDPWRNFILATRAAVAAPWNVSDGTDLFAGDTPYQQSIVVSGNQLANNIYFIGESTLLNALNATFVGDGTTKVFNTPLDVGATPTITLNSGAQTVGILGVDTGMDWYWSQGSTAITQDSGGTVLVASDTLVVSYLTATPAVAMAPNVASLQQLQAIEGTSANYDYSSSVTQPILPADLLALAAGYEAEYGEPATTCQFYTLRPGLAAGQLQTIALPDSGIPSGSFLIATIQMTVIEHVIVWQYTAFGGANIGNALTQLTQFINRFQPTLNIITPTVPITSAGSAALVSGQNVAGNSNGGTPLPFPNPVTPGNLMVIVAERNSVLGNPPTVTDTLGSTWTQAIFAASGGGFPNQISLLYAFVPQPGGANAIHCDSAEFFSIMEFTGIDTLASPVTTGSNVATAPGLTLPTQDLLVVTGMCGVPNVPTATAPETVLSYHTDTSQPGVAMSAEIVASSGAFTSSLLSSGSGPTTVYVSVAFTPPPATAPPAQTINVQQSGFVPTTRDINTMAPLTGGGSLASDLTLGVNVATSSTFGIVKPDNSTITISGGVISASGGGGGGAGALVLLEEHSASASAFLAFNTRNAVGQSGATFQSDFDDYMIEIVALLSATTGGIMQMQVSSNGGSSYDTGSNYFDNSWRWNSGGAAQDGGAGPQLSLSSGSDGLNSSSTLGGFCATGRIMIPLSTAPFPRFIVSSTYETIGSLFQGCEMRGIYLGGVAINAFKIFDSAGNLTSGTVRIYGIAK